MGLVQESNTTDDKSQQFIASQNIQNRSHLGRWLMGFLVVLLLAAGIYGGYWYGHRQVKTIVKTATQNQPSTTTSGQTTSTTTVHFVNGVGYPLDDKKALKLSLGLPAAYQGVLLDATEVKGSVADYLSTSLNNELASWAIGSPTDTSSQGSSAAIVAIDKDWLSGSAPMAAQPTDSATFWTDISNTVDCPYILFGCNLKSANDRQNYLTMMASKPSPA